ncbi:MAG: alpha/beta hydrolase [Chloroflexales bacterium]|nr:alpha/beta hydrolase [Chloroflexales bacterium]
MSGWESGFAEVQGLGIHYTRTGGHLPPLVLAHGIGDDGLCWTTVAEALAPIFDVVMVDARGHGRSAAPLQGYGPAEQATDLGGLITALGLRQPVVLGHSMGAMTTLMLAGTAPDMPRAILLEDPPPWWVRTVTSALAERERRVATRVAMAELKRKTRAELIAGQRTVAPTWPEAELERWADSKIRFSPNILSLFTDGAEARVDWPAVLGQIRCPVLLITGDPQAGALVTPEDAATLRDLIPQAQVAHIAGVGHSIRHDQFARYIDIVRGFLDTAVGAP